MTDFTESPLVSPWLESFSQNYATLKQIGGQIPPNMRAAYDALLRAGATIQATIVGGNVVASDDAKQWLYAAKNFATRLKSASGATIAQTSDAGMATPDDGFFSGLDVLGGQVRDAAGRIVQSAVQHASDTVEEAMSSVPWVWIGVGIVAIFVLPAIIENAEGGAHKRRAAS